MPPRKPQVPGEPVEDQAELDQNEDGTTVDSASDEEETVTVSKASLNALLARVEALEKAPAQAVSRRSNPEAHLPDQKDIDPKTIKSSQLSKQGWVVPESLGANPNAKGL